MLYNLYQSSARCRLYCSVYIRNEICQEGEELFTHSENPEKSHDFLHRVDHLFPRLSDHLFPRLSDHLFPPSLPTTF